jgi:hypothetical protein
MRNQPTIGVKATQKARPELEIEITPAMIAAGFSEFDSR